MIVEYTITQFDGRLVATVVTDASAIVSEYGALTGIEEAGKAVCAFMEATLGGEILLWEEVRDGYWTELPHSNGWLSGPGIEMPFSFRWDDGYEPMG